MFDKLGRVLCTECMSTMTTIASTRERVAFRCTSKECGRITSYCLTMPDRGRRSVGVEASIPSSMRPAS
jgi:hypothetical protein